MTPDFHVFDVRARHGVRWIRSPTAEAGLFEALVERAAVSIGDEIDPATGIERTHPVTPAFVRSQRLMMLCTSAGFLDRCDDVPGHPSVPVSAVWETAVQPDGIRFASLEWLRKLKRAAGRPTEV